MNFKKLLILCLISFYSFTIFAQNSSNPYREFVEKELAKSLEDTATLPIRYVYKTQESYACYSEVTIFPRMVERNNPLDEYSYKNIIYKSNAIGVIWLGHLGINQDSIKYRLLVITLNEDIFYAKTYSKDTKVAIIPLTEDMVKENMFITKVIPYTSNDETDEQLMGKERGIVLHFADSTQQQKIEQDLAKYCNTKNLIMNKLIEAYYCEVNGYLANAIGLYQEVMAAEPNNLHYKKLYKNFLKVTGMDFIR
jgi:hypothetical protein